MVKSKVIKELANNEITLEVAINRLLLIASDLDNDLLSQWAESELNGYPHDGTIPTYRIISTSMFQYSGINGRFLVKNLPLSIDALLGPKDKRDPEMDITSIKVTDGIKILEDVIIGGHHYERDFTWAAHIVESRTGIQCTSIRQIIPINCLETVVSTVKTLLIKIFNKLDKSYGCLDDLDINLNGKKPEDVEKINAIVNNYIFQDHSIKIGDNNRIKDSDILAGIKAHEEK